MRDPDLITLFVQPLIGLNIRYMVSGSVAAMLFGEPRMTHDIDLIAFLDAPAIAHLPMAFPAPEFYLPPPEVITVEVRRERRRHFNVIHLASGLKADFYLSNRDELHHWAIERTQCVAVGAGEVTVAPMEYVILRKLEYYREGHSEKHVRDIHGMLALSGDRLDRTALGNWLERMGLTAEWERMAAERG